MRYITSESVTKGHPDKVADQISDAILDECLKQDKYSRVAVETAVTEQYVLIMGEVTTKAKVDYETIARRVIRDIGYTDTNIGFDYKNCKIDVRIHEQSSDIAAATTEENLGAGDQGIVFGYATNETDELMPAAIYYARKLAEKLAKVRENNILSYLKPDGKSQVTCEYSGNELVRISTILISTQHKEGVSQDKIKKDIIENVIKETIPEELLQDTEIIVNPSGNFVIGGPAGDSGLTGRKIIVDTYGGYCPHGGGAFSGKDPTKVDRSAAYMARYIAKKIVATGKADRCQIQIAYAIGIEKPVSINVNTFGTGIIDDEQLEIEISNNYDLTPKGIIDFLELRENPIYEKLAAYGHIGSEYGKWEKVDD